MPEPARESRRYDFPPLWVIPLLLIVGIGLVVYWGAALGLLGLAAALVLVWWLERKVDAYVRERTAAKD